MREMEHFKIIIKNNETICERDFSFINRKGILSQATRTTESKNNIEDKYDKKIGVIVCILKSFFISRRIIRKIVDILLEENKE